jgi:prefoldin alpha subunit
MDEKEMQEKAILYQIMQKHMESLGQNATLLERRYEELEMTRQALEDIGKLKEKNDILVPVGSGFFTRGKISDFKNMLVDIGAGIFMDKDPDSSKRLLEDRKKEIEKLADELQSEMNEVSSRINTLTTEIEQASHQGQEHEHKHEHAGKGKDHPRKDE